MSEVNDYVLQRIRKQNPQLKFDTWDEFLSIPMSQVRKETINEILEDPSIMDKIIEAADYDTKTTK